MSSPSYLLVSVDVPGKLPPECVRAVGEHEVCDPLLHLSAPALGHNARDRGCNTEVHQKPFGSRGSGCAPGTGTLKHFVCH